MPISSEGDLPETTVGSVLAIADKLDSIFSFFAVGMIPSGSNDPYALRRQAYGVVRIIESKNGPFLCLFCKKRLVKLSVKIRIVLALACQRTTTGDRLYQRPSAPIIDNEEYPS